MTEIGTIAAGAAAPGGKTIVAGAPRWRAEIAATVKLALPLALTQLGQIAMMTTDLALIGRLGEDAVAAASLATNVFFTLFVLGLGPMFATAPLAAQAMGARAPRTVRRATRQGLWAGLALGVPFSIAAQFGEPLLLTLDQDPKLARLAGEYIATLGLCLAPAFWVIVLRNFMSAVRRPEPALWVTLAAIPVNGVLAYALIHGAFGLPRLGMQGAGVATTIVHLLMVAAMAWMALAMRPFRKFHVLGRLWRADWPLFRALFVVGAPISGSVLLEFGFFGGAAIVMGWIGTTALAAHQVALQIASFTFMAPLGISQAATVRVGHAVGRGDGPGARRAGFVAIGLGAVFMAAMALLIFLLRHDLPAIFLSGGGATIQVTLALVATLLLLTATFQVFDGVQVIAVGALRGLNDVRVPIIYAVIGYWLIGFAAGYAFAFGAGWGAIGIWVGFVVGLVAFAALGTWRFHRLTRDGALPDWARMNP
jgi:MATE family multidrug resistance protein